MRRNEFMFKSTLSLPKQRCISYKQFLLGKSNIFLPARCYVTLIDGQQRSRLVPLKMV